MDQNKKTVEEQVLEMIRLKVSASEILRVVAAAADESMRVANNVRSSVIKSTISDGSIGEDKLSLSVNNKFSRINERLNALEEGQLYIPITGITLSVSKNTINEGGESAVVTATITPVNATERYTFSSSNTSVLTVGENTGVVNSKPNAGTNSAIITCKSESGNVNATININTLAVAEADRVYYGRGINNPAAEPYSLVNFFKFTGDDLFIDTNVTETRNQYGWVSFKKEYTSSRKVLNESPDVPGSYIGSASYTFTFDGVEYEKFVSYKPGKFKIEEKAVEGNGGGSVPDSPGTPTEGNSSSGTLPVE